MRWNAGRLRRLGRGLLSLVGSITGVLLAMACMHLVLPFGGDSIPRVRQAGIDGSVLVFSIVLALFTSVLFSLAPALQLARVELVSSLNTEELRVAVTVILLNAVGAAASQISAVPACALVRRRSFQVRPPPVTDEKVSPALRLGPSEVMNATSRSLAALVDIGPALIDVAAAL